MEQIVDNIEEIEEEFLILRDLCIHPNIPSFHGLYFKRHPSKRENDQLWFVMEVICTYHFTRERFVQPEAARCTEKLMPVFFIFAVNSMQTSYAPVVQ